MAVNVRRAVETVGEAEAMEMCHFHNYFNWFIHFDSVSQSQ